jgi:signal transduction histidine kinase/ActR/RegA family two-component response regulator
LWCIVKGEHMAGVSGFGSRRRWRNRAVVLGQRLLAHSRGFVVGLLIAFLVVGMARWAYQSEQDHIALLCAEAANLVQSELEQSLHMRLLAAQRMAGRAEAFGNEQHWQYEAQSYVRDFPGIQAVAFITPELTVASVVPVTGNEVFQDVVLGNDPRHQAPFVQAHDAWTATYWGDMALLDGGRGFAYITPTVSVDRFLGYFVLVYRYDTLLDELLRPAVAPGYNIKIYDNHTLIYQRRALNPSSEIPTEIRRVTAGPGDALWQIAVSPLPRLYARQQSHLDEAILGIGLVVALLCLLLVNRVHSLRLTEGALRHLNEDLEARVDARTESLVNQQRRLRALAAELATAEQRERRRIAGELHDYLAQQLVAMRLKLSIVRRHEDGRAKQDLQHVDELLASSLKYTRTLIAELYPVVLYESGISEAARWLASHMQQHGLEVHVTESGEPVAYDDDRAAVLFQSMRELLLNVVKHANTREAWVGVVWAEEGITISVEDRGLGTSAFQNESDNADSFGLFNIQQRIESWGGTLGLESAPGRGTRARIFMPRESTDDTVALESQELLVRAVLSPAKAAAASSHLRVLIVDDHDLIRHALRKMLEGFEKVVVIGEARDGEEAVARALSLSPDVVLMDVNLPKINGIEATRRIKRASPHVRVIGLSVHQEEQLSSAMLVAGASAYIAKGGAPDELYRAIMNVVESAVVEARS